jgi:hypothetical protein
LDSLWDTDFANSYRVNAYGNIVKAGINNASLKAEKVERRLERA